ncbi:hypothetical protein D3C72_2066180 [compost metagenome]
MTNAVAVNRTPTKAMRQMAKPSRMDLPGARGGRCIMPGSAGSNARPNDSVVDVAMFIHRICSGDSGASAPARIATMTSSACARLVGRMKSMVFLRLS